VEFTIIGVVLDRKNEAQVKRILYISPNGYLGGAERFVLDACLGHKEHGVYEPHILFFSTGRAQEMALELDIAHTILKNSFRLSRPLSLLKALREIRLFLKRQNFPIYNATMPYAHIVASLASFGMTLKRTWYQHGPVGGLLDQIASFFKVDQLYFNSEWTKRRHYQTALFCGEGHKDFLVPYGIKDTEVEEQEVLSIRSKMKRGQECIYLLAAGRICPWKGYETLLKALDTIRRSNLFYEKNLKLMIVGDVGRETDRSYKQSLQSYVKDNALEEIVEFLGQKQDLYNYFKASDIFIHCSSSPEPFGLVVAEAMIQETFVVGSNQGGTSDVLHDGVNGLAFNPVSERAQSNLEMSLGAALSLYRKDREQFDYLRKQGRLTVRENFNVGKMTLLLEELYDRA